MRGKKRRIFAIFFILLLLVPKMGCMEAEHQKVVYLTFDDGPKESTPELLELLEKLDVPATFFLVGLAVRHFPEYTQMIYDRGYPIGCHTMDHSSGGIKENPEEIGSVLNRFLMEVRAAVGEDFSTDLFRFPGGSTSYPWHTKEQVVRNGWAWFDWNAMTGDTLPDMEGPAIVKYVMQTTSEEEEVVILLAHDGKKFTRDALPEIVAFYRDKGYEFRTLSTDAEEREILERCQANMGLPPEPLQ